MFRTRGLDADQTEAAIKATVKMLNIIEAEYERWIKVLLIDCMLIAVYCGVKVVLCLWNDKPVDWEEILLIGAAVAVPYYVLAYLCCI